MPKARNCLALIAAAFAARACSPEAPPPSNEQNVSSATAASQVQPAQPAPASTAKAETAAPKVAAAGRRCGWLHNPTPANWWLVDRDGQWILGTQGREPVAGMDEMPDMSAVEWVETNGSYGYGCACIDMEVDPVSGDVLRISGATPKAIAQCRRDKSLPKPEE